MRALRVLIVEDSEDDAILMLRELSKSDYQITSKRVDDSDQMAKALAEDNWDLILADYSVPGFGALSALALVKGTGLDIPFIIVTGSIDDETAVLAMKAGASDYIMKDKLNRLGPAVERELRESAIRGDRKQAQAEIARTTAKLTTIVEMLPDIFFIKDISGKYQMVNAAFEEFTGMSRSAILGKSGHDCYPNDMAEQLQTADRESMANKTVVRIESMAVINKHTVYLDTVRVPLTDTSGAVIGIVGISRDITEKKKTEIELQQRLTQLQSAWKQTVRILSDAVEVKDAYTAGHQKRVAILAVAIGQELGLSQDALTGLEMAALIHDIGKLRVPGELLSKPGKLIAAEFELIKTHSEAGREILQGADLPWDIAEIIFQHHERFDGSGYPRGLKGNQILLEAKIIAVADVVEAMSAHRPYRPALGIDAALNEIEHKRGQLYDPAVADACLSLYEEKGFSLYDR